VKANLRVVGLHNRLAGGQPASYFAHFWAKGPAADLASGPKSAIDAQAASSNKGKH
jgi:hypothetical protein